MEYKYELGKRLKKYPTKDAEIYVVIYRYEEGPKDYKAARYVIMREDNKGQPSIIGDGNTMYESDYLPPNELKLSKIVGKEIQDAKMLDRSELELFFKDGTKFNIDIEEYTCKYTDETESELDFTFYDKE